MASREIGESSSSEISGKARVGNAQFGMRNRLRKELDLTTSGWLVALTTRELTDVVGASGVKLGKRTDHATGPLQHEQSGPSAIKTIVTIDKYNGTSSC